MSPASSVSSSGALRWGYIRPELGRTGRTIAENNFAKEKRGWLSILLREILQNALDARISQTEPVTVCLRRHALPESGQTFAEELIPAEHIKRFKESVPHLQEEETPTFTDWLVVEDFGTSGLTGVLNDPERDGKGENWNAFWFREGEGGKERGAGNGGAGQGKITYFSTSRIRTIFGFTVRSSDQSFALFGASSFLRDYKYGEHKWKRDAYWGIWRDARAYPEVLPIQGEEVIAEFREHLGLVRELGQPGLSLAIPSPTAFDDDEAVAITLAEFFVPIERGDLVVRVGEVTIDKSSVMALADSRLSDAKARELHTCTTAGFRAFAAEAIDRSRRGELIDVKSVTNAAGLTDTSFEPEHLVTLRDALQNERPVSVRIHLSIKPKGTSVVSGFFDVHLHRPYDLEQPEQAVIRRDLLVGEEPIGAGRLKQRARGLTLVSHDELSTLLLCAEEATHLKWNSRLPRLSEYYKSGPEVVALVRNGMARVLEVLDEGTQALDYKILAKYFSTPGDSRPNPQKGRKQKGKRLVDPPPIPAPTPKLLVLNALVDGCRIQPAKVGALEGANLPISVSVDFAYEGLDKDAFSEYDPMDFDLADETFAVQSSGCSNIERKLNRLTFLIDARDFVITVSGFDSRLRLRMRLLYEESASAATVDAE